MKELRMLSSDALRGLCVKHNWFTSGDDSEYEKLMSYVESKNSISMFDIVSIAIKILEHSANYEYQLSVICYEIEKECIVFPQ